MNNSYIIFWKHGFLVGTFFLFITFVSCDHNRLERNFPRMVTHVVTDININSGAVLNGEVIIYESSNISEHGFVWNDEQNPVIGASEIIKFGGRSESGIISAQVSTTLETDVEYYVRAFARVNDLVVYGNEMRFVSLGSEAPSVTSVDPINGDMGDTLIVLGNNFSAFSEKNSVFFGSIKAKIVKASSDSIATIIPDFLEGSSLKIKVSVLGNISSSHALFKLNPPVISSFNPVEVVSGDFVEIIGKNFVKDSTVVYAGGVSTLPQGEMEYVRHNSIKFRLPDEAPAGKIALKVQVFEQLTVAEDSLLNESPILLDFNPKVGNVLDTIHVIGKNIGSVVNVTVGGILVQKLGDSMPDQFDLIVPSGLNEAYSELKIKVKYKNKYFYLVGSSDFQLKAPTIDSLSGNTALFGSLITIYGTNFTPESKVRFGVTDATISQVFQDSIQVYVPDINLGPIEIIVSSAGRTVSSPVLFELIAPEITGVDKQIVEVGDTIEVSGIFSPDLHSNILFIDNSPVQHYIEGTNLSIKFQVPVPDFNLSNHDITLQVGQDSKTLSGVLQIREPSITSVLPNSVGIQDVTILAGHFPMLDEFNGVITVNGIEANILQASKNELKMQMLEFIDFGLYDITITLGGKPFIFADQLAFPWKEYSLTEAQVGYLYSFNIGNKIYYLYGFEFFELDPITNQINQLASLPYSKPYNPSFKPFEIGGKGYFGLETDSVTLFWEYDPILDSWSKKQSLTQPFRSGFSMSFNNKAYVGNGILPDTMDPNESIWEYDPALDQWTQKGNFPGTLRYDSKGITVLNSGYLFGGIDRNFDNIPEAWQYDPVSDIWNLQGPVPLCGAEGLPFLNDNKLYIGGACESEMWHYDYSNDSWVKAARPSKLINQTITSVEGAFRPRTAFTILGKTYFFAYVVSRYPYDLTTTQETWVFDPSIIQQ